MKKSVSYGVGAVAGLGLASAAQAYEIRARGVSRIGTGVPVDVVPGNTFDATTLAPGTAIRFRLQFGCFDDDPGRGGGAPRPGRAGRVAPTA